MSPDYQRMGGVWTPEKKQLLIDSILNDYDLPKIYFHAFSRDQRKETGYAYAVIDGRQRLETIWQFIEGRFSLSDDFVYQEDEGISLANLGYSDIASNYPKIKIKFDSFVLPVVGVSTDDQDLIEDMFSRLNEAVPLNATKTERHWGCACLCDSRSRVPRFLHAQRGFRKSEVSTPGGGSPISACRRKRSNDRKAC